MAKIRVDITGIIEDGRLVTFKAPCDCTAIDGLVVYYTLPSDRYNNSSRTPEEFKLCDAHGNNLAGLGNLFTAGAYVHVILDTANRKAYIQNAATNSYIENKFAELGGGGAGGGISMDLLWENAAPTASFAAQTITVPNMNDYAFLLYMYKFKNANGQINSTASLNYDNCSCLLMAIGKNQYGRRIVKRIDATTISVEGGAYAEKDDDDYCIPVKIYGIRCGINDLTIQ